MELLADVGAALAAICLLLLGYAVRGVVMAVAGTATRAALLRVTLTLLGLWVHCYTQLLDPDERQIRRADFRRIILWGRYRRLRRRGYQAPEIAMQLLDRERRDMPGDLREVGQAVSARMLAALAGRFWSLVRRLRPGPRTQFLRPKSANVRVTSAALRVGIAAPTVRATGYAGAQAQATGIKRSQARAQGSIGARGQCSTVAVPGPTASGEGTPPPRRPPA
jgi:hypothetical protein